MKKRNPKLTLSRDTLRLLDRREIVADEFKKAQGAVETETDIDIKKLKQTIGYSCNCY